MLGSQMPGITPTPFNIGQFGQFPNIGMQGIPMQTPGLWTGQYGMPGIGQNLGFGMPGLPGLGMPGLPGLGMQGLPGLGGIGQNIPGATPYGLFGGLGQNIPGATPYGLFGGLGQNIPGTSPYGLFGGLGQQLGGLGGIFGGIGQQQGFGMPGLNPFNIPSFTVHSVAVITPSFDPLAQLRQFGQQGILNPFDQFGQQFGQQLGQQFGQLSPFGYGGQPFMGGRQVVRAYVQTMMGVIPIDLVI